MYNEDELFIFSYLYSTNNIVIQNIAYKIFNLSIQNNINFFGLTEKDKLYFLKENFNSEKINIILKLTEKENLFSMAMEKNKILEECRKENIKLLFYSDKNYPKSLIGIKEPPFILYIRGHFPNEEELSKSYAIVGTRNPNEKGINFVKEVGKFLKNNNYYNISGLAKGIDEIGHWVTLGKTAAILGQGLNTAIYPCNNKKLSDEILKNNGFLLSELLPNTKISTFNLLKRNRLQSALTSGIIIGQTALKGGTVQTFKYAKTQKKKIFISDFNEDFINKYKKDLFILKDEKTFKYLLDDSFSQNLQIKLF